MTDQTTLQQRPDQGKTPLVQAQVEIEEETHEEPKSTFVLMLFFLMLLAGIWFYAYQLLIARQ